MSARPHGAVLALLCAALAVLPVASALGLGEIGGYRMFTRLVRVRLELHAEDAGGVVSEIGIDELRPHLGRDARRVLGGALGPGTLGDVSVSSIRAAALPLGELGCALDPARVRVRATVITFDGGETRVEETVHPCAR
jgi:hypothetical protein